MRNQKGISLMKLIVIIAIIILGIVFIVAMSKPQNGIGSSEKETREWEEQQERTNKALKDAEEADKNYNQALQELEQIERNNR